MSGDEILDQNMGEHMGVFLRLICVESHLESGHLLLLFAQDGNYIHRSATGQPGSDQLHRAKAIVVSSYIRIGA